MTKAIRTLLGVGVLLSGLVGASTSATAGTVVVNFDDLPPGPNTSGLVPDGYGGIAWGGDWTYFNAFQPPYTASSPATRVYGTLQDDGEYAARPSFSFAAPTAFDGAYFSGYEEVGGATNSVHFELYLGGALVHTSASLTPSAVPTFLSSGWAGQIDTVVVVPAFPGFYAMDDVTYEAAVPEPSSVVTLGLGALGLAAAVRRRNSRRASS